jgi:hypothetical protein
VPEKVIKNIKNRVEFRLAFNRILANKVTGNYQLCHEIFDPRFVFINIFEFILLIKKNEGQKSRDTVSLRSAAEKN